MFKVKFGKYIHTYIIAIKCLFLSMEANIYTFIYIYTHNIDMHVHVYIFIYIYFKKMKI